MAIAASYNFSDQVKADAFAWRLRHQEQTIGCEAHYAVPNKDAVYVVNVSFKTRRQQDFADGLYIGLTHQFEK